MGLKNLIKGVQKAIDDSAKTVGKGVVGGVQNIGNVAGDIGNFGQKSIVKPLANNVAKPLISAATAPIVAPFMMLDTSAAGKQRAQTKSLEALGTIAGAVLPAAPIARGIAGGMLYGASTASNRGLNTFDALRSPEAGMGAALGAAPFVAGKAVSRIATKPAIKLTAPEARSVFTRASTGEIQLPKVLGQLSGAERSQAIKQGYTSEQRVLRDWAAKLLGKKENVGKIKTVVSNRMLMADNRGAGAAAKIEQIIADKTIPASTKLSQLTTIRDSLPATQRSQVPQMVLDMLKRQVTPARDAFSRPMEVSMQPGATRTSTGGYKPSTSVKDKISSIRALSGNNAAQDVSKLISDAAKYPDATSFENDHMMSNLMDLSNPEKHRFGRIFTDDGNGNIQDVTAISKMYGRNGSKDLSYYPEANVPDTTNGNELVTIYRSAPEGTGGIKPGDWVSFNREYAASHDRGKVYSMKITAKNVIWAQSDFNEWIYSPHSIRKEFPGGLKDIYQAAKGGATTQNQTVTRDPFRRPEDITDTMGFTQSVGDLAMGRQTGNLSSPVVSQVLSPSQSRMRPSDNRTQVMAYHGSPYAFDKFDASKIGTGEGAQAFGHGLYFTDSKDIAKFYSKRGENTADIYRQIKSILQEKKSIPISNKQELQWDYQDRMPVIRDTTTGQITTASDSIISRIVNENVKGNTYSVTLHKGKTPDQYDYLRWDKRLSVKHDEKIKNQLQKELSPEKYQQALNFMATRGPRIGANKYKALRDIFGGEKQASDFLLRAGIDGIKYPAGSLSGVNSDAFNYVVFDPSAVTIDKVNDKPIETYTGRQTGTTTLSARVAELPKAERENIRNSVNQERERLIQSQVEFLKQDGFKGVSQGGLARGVNEFTGMEDKVTGRFGRTSNNPQWYRDFYAQNGRKPNNTDLRNIAIEQLSNGFKDDVGGAIPANAQFVEVNSVLNEIDATTKKPTIKVTPTKSPVVFRNGKFVGATGEVQPAPKRVEVLRPGQSEYSLPQPTRSQSDIPAGTPSSNPSDLSTVKLLEAGRTIPDEVKPSTGKRLFKKGYRDLNIVTQGKQGKKLYVGPTGEVTRGLQLDPAFATKMRKNGVEVNLTDKEGYLIEGELQKAIETAIANKKDKYILSLHNTTPDRNLEDIFGNDAPVVKKYTVEAARTNETKNVTWQNEQVAEIKRKFDQWGIKQGSTDDQLVHRFAEKRITLDELKGATKNWKNVADAAGYVRAKYDSYLDQINAAITKYGYDPIPKRENYVTHFQELGLIDDMFGGILSLSKEQIPNIMNMIHLNTKPGKQFFQFGLERKGAKFTETALGSLGSYIPSAGKQIFHTDTVQKARTFEKALNAEYEKNGLDKSQSNFSKWAVDYVNQLSGKSSIIDRGVEGMLGRPIVKLMDFLRGRSSANMVGANMSSALTNFIPITQSMATTGKVPFTKGLFSSFAAPFQRHPEIIDGVQSSFLTRRFGSDKLAPGLSDKVRETAGLLFEAVDKFTARTVVSGKYFENIDKGMSTEQAMRSADEYAAGVMADRSFGQMPTLYNSKTMGLLTQFQLEVNNQFQFLSKDVPKTNKGNYAKTAAVLAQVAVYGYLFNNVIEQLTGRRPALDPIDLTMSAIDDVQDGKEEALTNALEKVSNNLPYVNVLTGGGRIPAFDVLPNPYNILSGDELSKAFYMLPPTAGGQIKKSIEGLTSFDRGFSDTSNVVEKLQGQTGNIRYPIAQTPENAVRTAVFGQYATPEARQYFDAGQKPLSKNQTALLVNNGTGQYSTIRNNQAQTKAENKIKDEVLKSGTAKTDAAGKIYYLGADGSVGTFDLSKTIDLPKKSVVKEINDRSLSKYQSQLTSRINEVVDAYNAGVITDEQVNPILDDLEAKVAALDAQDAKKQLEQYNTEYALEYDRATRAKDYTLKTALMNDKIAYLTEYQAKLDPVKDKKEITSVQNTIEDLQASLAKSSGSGSKKLKIKTTKLTLPKVNLSVPKRKTVKFTRSKQVWRVRKPPTINMKVSK
jgi:hypothetical protein